MILTLPVPISSEEKKLIYIFICILFVVLKRSYVGLSSFHKTFWDTKKKFENKDLSKFLS